MLTLKGNETRNREDHIAWCKEQALKLLEKQGSDIENVYAFFIGRLNEHPGTEEHEAGLLGLYLIVLGGISEREEMKKWIKDFN